MSETKDIFGFKRSGHYRPPGMVAGTQGRGQRCNVREGARGRLVLPSDAVSWRCYVCDAGRGEYRRVGQELRRIKLSRMTGAVGGLDFAVPR